MWMQVPPLFDRSIRSRLKRFIPALLSLAVVLAPVGPGITAQTGDLTEQSLEDLMNIRVTSVSKREQKMSDAAAAIFVISSEDIRRSGALNIPDLLRMVPGMDVAQLDSSRWAVSTRGFNGQYSNMLLVLVDGRTVYNPIFAGVFWDSQTMLLEDIERIEVIRGPGAAVWGSNAVNGVINIITRTAAETKGGLVTAGGGSSAAVPQTIRYGGNLGKLGVYRIFAQGLESAQSQAVDGTEPKDWRLVRGGFRADTVLSGRDSIAAEAEAFSGSSGELVTAPVSLYPPRMADLSLTERYSGWDWMAQWSHTISANSGTRLQFYFDRTTRGDPTYGLGINTVDIDFQQHAKIGSRHDLVWGAGYRLGADDTDPTPRISFNPNQRRTQIFSSFVQDEIALLPNRLLLNIGTRFEHNDYSGSSLQPSSRLAWRLNPAQMVWFGISHADRSPARSDADVRVNYAVFPGPQGLTTIVGLLPNRTPKDGELTAFEAGHRGALGGRLSIDSTVFFNRYQRLTSVETGSPFVETKSGAPDLLIPTYQGSDIHGESHGLETFANWRLTDRLTVSPGYAFFTMHLHNSPGVMDQTTAAQTQAATPDHKAQLRMTFAMPRGLAWNASAYFVDRMRSAAVPGDVRLDTGVSWRAGERLLLQAGGQNLLKATHQEFAGPDSSVDPELIRRSGYVKAVWTF